MAFDYLEHRLRDSPRNLRTDPSLRRSAPIADRLRRSSERSRRRRSCAPGRNRRASRAPSASRRDWRSPGRVRGTEWAFWAISTGRIRRVVDEDILRRDHDTSTAWRNALTSNSPRSSRNLSRLSEARLQAESSRCMYSLHGFDALIRPLFGQVCQRIDRGVELHPGVAAGPRRLGDHAEHVARAVAHRRLRRRLTKRVCHSPSLTIARMNSSVTRTELLAFWKKTEP